MKIQLENHLQWAGSATSPPHRGGATIRSHDFFSASDPADLDLVKRAGISVPLAAGKVLSGQGRDVGAVYVLESGVVGVSVALTDGRRLGLHLEGPGALVGAEDCFPGGAGVGEVSVLAAGTGWRVARSVFVDLVRARPGLALWVAGQFVRRNEQLQTELACSVIHGIVPRLARALHHAFEVTGASALTITQEELAVMLRTQRTTISEAAGHLKARGAISHLRGVIQLIDKARLRSMSCGCAVRAV